MVDNQVHTWEKGMNKDLALSKLGQGQYLDANNFRISTQDGGSTISLVTVEGNTWSFTIPDTQASYRLTALNRNAHSFDINNITITVNTASNNRDFLTQIVNTINNHPSLPTVNASRLKDNTGLVIYDNRGLGVTILENPTVFSKSVYIDVQTDLKPIGYCMLRDSIILFTTRVDSDNGFYHTGNIGQIWQVYHDASTKQVTQVKLVYNNNLRFSTKFPIRALGIYENNNVSHIYFTDNNSKPKSLNISDVDAFALQPDMLNINSPFKPSVPVVDKIDTGGSLKSGLYHLFYLQMNRYGTTSATSPISNGINIVADLESSTIGFQDYEGTKPGAITSKSIKFTINNLDLNYDTIVLGYIYYSEINQIPDIKIFKELKLTGSSISSTLTGGESSRSITYDQFVNPVVNFSTVKEMVQKENILFYMNTKTESFDIDFDARAYRYKLWSENTYVNFPVPEDADAINPYNDESNYEDWKANQQYKYQYNSDTLGGTGLNVSYKFTHRQLSGDIQGSQGDLGDPHKTSPITKPFIQSKRTGDTSVSLGIPGQIYKLPDHFNSFKSPYISHLFAGYARGEVYRFGIVFYKAGRASFVKWIGDIKFPTESEFPPYRVGGLDYQLNDGSVVLNTLGVEFTVNISSIKNEIDGYSIVRVHRSEDDKTRLGTGILNTLRKTGIRTFANDNSVISDTEAYTITINLNTDVGTNASTNAFNFDGPDSHFNTINYKNGDYLKLIKRLDILRYSDEFINDGYWKKYLGGDSTILGQPIVTLKSYTVVENYGMVKKNSINGLAYDFRNFGKKNYALNYALEYASAGTRTALVTLNSDINHPDYGIPQGSTYKLFVSYERINNGQYGGNSYSDRSRNEYIGCNNYIHINPSSANSLTFQVYGGDTYVTFYDHTKLEKNWGEQATGIPSEGGDKMLAAQMYPVESSINVDLRTGHHFANKGTTGNYPDDGSQIYDQFIYYGTYSRPNNLINFFSKPFDWEASEIEDHRIWASQVKSAGEYSDSWTIFKPADYLDAESQYGAINAASVFKDKLICLQDRGVGYLLVNPISMVTDSNGSSIMMGTGEKMQKYSYVSTTMGCQHRWSMVNTGNGLYWYDSLNKILCKLGDGVQPLSTIGGMHSYLQNNFKGDINKNDNPLEGRGVVSGYDGIHNEVLFTFHDVHNGQVNKKTIVFSELTNAFIGFYSFASSMYINTIDKLLSIRPNARNEAWLHNTGPHCTFYSQTFEPNITIVSNKHPDSIKVYDNIDLFANCIELDQDIPVDFKEYIGKNDYQTTDIIPLDTNLIKRRERHWRMAVPRDINNSIHTTLRSRMRDKYLISKFIFNQNTSLKKITLDLIRVFFRRSIS
jgi:hypothetical protein